MYDNKIMLVSFNFNFQLVIMVAFRQLHEAARTASLTRQPCFQQLLRGHKNEFTFSVCLFGWLVGLVFVCEDRVSLCGPECPKTLAADHAGFRLRDLPAAAS